MRVACIGYRMWALNIYDRLADALDDVFLIFRTRAQYNEEVLKDFRPDLVLFYGWSWHVSEKIIKDYKCLMLHPSPLPRYRGGSPIQNQIINGEKNSKVSIFIMNNEIDAGDIVAQENISLEGSIHDVLSRIEDAGVRLTLKLLDVGLNPVAQNHGEATYCKRRNPEDSEITLEELSVSKASYLYNKIRMLGDPYPNAFIRTVDGKKLLIKDAEIRDN
jgi:methionyl-tRNA formyltransferase